MNNFQKWENNILSLIHILISKRYFEGRTQMEIADEIGISQAQVSRLEKDAIKHMRRLYK